MSVSLSQEYVNPATGLKKFATITLDVTKGRLDSDTSSAQERILLKATGSGQSDVYIDIDKVAQDALSGKASSAQDSYTESYLRTSIVNGATLLPLLSVTGFAVGDPICIKSNYDSIDQDYAVITAISANDLTVSTDGSGTGISNTGGYKQFAIVQRLAGRDLGTGLGSGSVPGIKAQLERPVAVTGVKLTTGGPTNSINVLFTPSTSQVASYYDIYASRAQLATLPENRVPNYQDGIYTGVNFNVTKYSESDNVEYNLQASTKWYVYVVAKASQGQRDVKESAATEGSISL